MQLGLATATGNSVHKSIILDITLIVSAPKLREAQSSLAFRWKVSVELSLRNRAYTKFNSLRTMKSVRHTVSGDTIEAVGLGGIDATGARRGGGERRGLGGRGSGCHKMGPSRRAVHGPPEREWGERKINGNLGDSVCFQRR